MKIVLKCIIAYIILIIFFVISLVVTSTIPSEALHDNVNTTAEILLQEGNRKKVYIPYRNMEMQFDNFSDALMINTAYSIDSANPLESAFLARKNYIPGKTKTVEEDAVGELKSSSKYGGYHNEVGDLLDLVNKDTEESFEYARYWHGYLIILRPLLALFDLNVIRILLFITIFALMAVLFYLLQKKTNVIIGIIFEIGLFCVEYFYLGFSLQGIFVFLITMIVSIVLLIRNEKMKSKVLLFLITGMLTNFFDFLTVPMITLCFPLMIVLLLNEKEENNTWKKIILEIVKLGIAWSIGYGLTWLTKWVLVDIFLKRNLVGVAFGQIGYRSVARDYTIFNAIGPNIEYENIFLPMSVIITIVMTIVYAFIAKPDSSKYKLQNILPYLFIAITPYIWYAVLKNHSAEHSFFTYRNQIITIIGLNICINHLILKLKKEE